MSSKLFRFTLLTILMLLLAAPVVWAAAVANSNGASDARNRQVRRDDRHSPLADKQAALKQVALEKKLQGKLTGKDKNGVVEVAEGQFVKLELEGEDPVWTMLGEFADFPHNNIAEPNRAYDNSTIWVQDFSRDYFNELLYDDSSGANSMRNYFLEQSSGRYGVYGDATDWVTVPEGYLYYDDSVGGEDTSTNVWLLLQDMADGWYEDQIAAGRTPAEIDAYLAQFDLLDRYDYDGDGEFKEPDGYIDHFQALHAGEGEEAGGGALGADAIWSHSWYANYADIDKTGPSPDYLLGGLKIGDTNYWIGDYTIQPENGGVGVFTHEFSHDLGVPDLYDYNYLENSTGFWTLMSSGSWLSDGAYDIGSKPGHLGAWEKFLLGWLDYDVAIAGDTAQTVLGPSEYNSSEKQALFVVLPEYQVTEVIGAPYAGTMFYFSGSANNLNNKMTKAFTLGAGSTLAAKVNYGIEEGYDFANVIASTDGGATWRTVPTNLSNSSVEANGIEGFSGGWVDLTADLSTFTGDVMLGFQYRSDGGVNYDGFMVDDIQITGQALDGAETDAGWTYDGFRATTGTEEKTYTHYYIAENKVYWGYDYTLKVGPYNFGFLNNPNLQNYVERFPYQDGMLVSYWNTRYANNDTDPSRPGTGMLLYVDAHPQALKRPDGAVWRNRVQTFDSTFSLARTDAITLHYNSKAATYKSLPAVRTFNDLTTYYDMKNPYGSVKLPKTGTKIRIDGVSSSGRYLQITVSPSKSPAR
ncbi:MAG TPA: immune inhibitor A domain-containing protein [Thermoleophilia bacterium]|nr:immune inhibitor A domain-containing protein [Thermoleophilia bacterium]